MSSHVFQALVHVSTAYCNCNRQEVSELVYPPPADPEKVIQCVEWMEDELLETITNKQVVSVITILAYGGVSESFRTGHVERELHMVQLYATRCSCIAIL